MMKKDKVAVILSGGGTSGSFEAGVLKVLLRNIRPDFFIASSMGAINIAAILKNKEPIEGAENLEKIWHYEEKRQKKFFKFRKIAYLSLFLTTHIYDNHNLKRLLKEHMGQQNIEDLSIPLYIKALNLNSGKIEFFEKGPAYDALMASCAAVPGLLSYKIGETHYADAGSDKISSIKKAKELGANKIILIKKKSEAPKKYNVLTLMIRHSDILHESSMYDYIKEIDSKVYFLCPENCLKFSFVDMSQTRPLIKLGEETAEKFFKKYSKDFLITSKKWTYKKDG